MGNHRSEPETTKHSVTFSNNRMDVVATGMCGWRMYMEDAHICDLNIGDGNTLFAVFDGHGGIF
jgi:serine/threonine protein phosphatase PrpC